MPFALRLSAHLAAKVLISFELLFSGASLELLIQKAAEELCNN